MFCTNCGSQFEDGNLFCPNCGTKVESVAQPVEAPAPVAAPVEAAAVAATPIESAPVQATPVEAEPVYATPVESAPVYATPVDAEPVYATPVEPAPAPAPQAVPVAPVQPVYTQATPVAPIASVAGANNPDLAKNILVMGIIAVATACTVWFSFLGIIFGAIGLSKAKKFTDECGQIFGKAKIGKFLSLGGLIGGACISAYVLIYFVIIIIAAVAENY
ncbi:MAG: zinc ribbon domain-containing protein [Clostridiales bacterium]|nr:zinc ribbon domain-containing protein [Clostridiales bacterium]